MRFSGTAKDQGWGNKKSRFAFTTDSIDKKYLENEIGEWSDLN